MGWDLSKHPQAQQFELEFVDGHLREMGFAIVQRLRRLEAPGACWTEVAGLDQRLVAHRRTWAAYGSRGVDGALELVRNECSNGIPDEEGVTGAAHAIGSAVGSADAGPLLAWLTGVSSELLPACERGLRLSVNPAFATILGDRLARLPPASDQASMLASVLAWRRQLAPAVARRLISEGSPATQAAAALGLAKTGCRDDAPTIQRALSRDSASVPLLSALAILGEPAALEQARALGATREPPPGILGLIALAGGAGDLHTLMQVPPSVESTHAMGTLGMPELIPELLERLGAEHEPEQRAAAASALNRITGAGLRESTPTPDDDAMAGADAGPATERDCQDRTRWIDYLRQPSARFDRRHRYRLGATFELGQCIREIAAPSTPLRDRRAAADEWMIRSGQVTPFEPDGWISDQQEAVRALSSAGGR